MENQYSSITDVPRNVSKGEKDSFGITPYEEGLAQFINNSNTPVTIALQGEWGSGKTSLMNSLKQTLTVSEQAQYHAIWLNTWEYALMKDASSILMDIITALTKKISNIAQLEKSQTQRIIKKLWGISKDTMTFAAKQAADQVVSGSSQLIDNLLDDKCEVSISEVRDELERVIADCIIKNNKKGIIFFIDDLDRIDPPTAVQLLELLKNIFTIQNCVFVLAIDYDVVIKGLEPKFGTFSDKNEREFRSFFDKLIQVPFSMPVTSYRLNDFLQESLSSINYLPSHLLKDQKLIADFSVIAELTVGTNPRAIKRLINSLSLINCINNKKLDENVDNQLDSELALLVNFALVSTQIAYPSVYRLLVRYPAFDCWDEKVALQMNLKPLDEASKEKLAQSEEFDEEWEQVLFRLCENDYYLKKRSLYISNLLNKLRDAINAKNESIEDIVDAVISLSSVTNLEAFDKPTVDYHKGNFLKGVRSRLLPLLSENLESVSVVAYGKRVQTNAYIHIGEQPYKIRLHSRSFEGKVRLTISMSRKICSEQGDFERSLSLSGKYDSYAQLKNNYDSFIQKYDQITTRSMGECLTKTKGYYELSLHHSFTLPTVNDFYTNEQLDIIATFITRLYPLIVDLYAL